MLFHTQLLNHVKAVHAWQRMRGGDIKIDLRTWRLQIINHGRTREFLPQFVFNVGGKIRYRPDLTDDVSGMIGWLPYFNKRWIEGFDKLAFKRAMLASGLNVPPHWTDATQPREHVIIKQPRLSFGEGMRGPFRMIDPIDPRHQLHGDEFYEQLIPGAMLKFWFWNDKPVCADLRHPPAVRGNGKDSILNLTVSAFDLHQWHRSGPFERAKEGMRDLLWFQGVDWDVVIPNGATVIVDFLYGSCLFPSTSANQNVLANVLSGPARQQVLDAGKAMYALIPADVREGSLYSADAVIDADSRIWWLEMNCNPMMPPETYAPMLDELFGYAPVAM